MKKKLMLSAAAVAMVGTLAVGGTLAWFTDTETSTNVVTTGHVDVMIKESLPTEGQQTAGGYTADVNADGEGIAYSGIEPGTVIDKNPAIVYEGSADAYVRYKVEVTAKQGDDELALSDGLQFFKKGKEVTDLFINDYVYSTRVFEEGETVAELFDQVKFSPTLGNELADAEITINIVADAIQADNLTTENGAAITTVDDLKAVFEGNQIADYDNDTAVVRPLN